MPEQNYRQGPFRQGTSSRLNGFPATSCCLRQPRITFEVTLDLTSIPDSTHLPLIDNPDTSK